MKRLRVVCISITIIALLVVGFKWYTSRSKLPISHLGIITLEELLSTEPISEYQLKGETYPHHPKVEYNPVSKVVTLNQYVPCRLISHTFSGNSFLLFDETGYGNIVSACMPIFNISKYDYSGRLLWDYAIDCDHPHGIGILAPKRRIIILWQMEPTCIVAIDWMTGKEIDRRYIDSSADGMAIDNNEEYCYLLTAYHSTIPVKYGINRFLIPVEWKTTRDVEVQHQ